MHLARLIGEAGFSRTVAVKRLHPQFGKDAEFVTMFTDEARVSARVQHPNVVSLFRTGEVAGHPFFVSEYVRGTSLNRLRGPLPPRHVVHIGIGLARGPAGLERLDRPRSAACLAQSRGHRDGHVGLTDTRVRPGDEVPHGRVSSIAWRVAWASSARSAAVELRGGIHTITSPSGRRMTPWSRARSHTTEPVNDSGGSGDPST